LAQLLVGLQACCCLGGLHLCLAHLREKQQHSIGCKMRPSQQLSVFGSPCST
jgi:hypothetical protein